MIRGVWFLMKIVRKMKSKGKRKVAMRMIERILMLHRKGDIHLQSIL